jgi:hypothetical protein
MNPPAGHVFIIIISSRDADKVIGEQGRRLAGVFLPWREAGTIITI